MHALLRPAVAAGLAGALALTTAGCGDDTTLPGTCSLNFDGRVDSNFGDARIDALLEGTASFNVAANQLEADVLRACNAIAADLGAETASAPNVACGNAKTAIETALTGVSGTVSLNVQVIPAVCTVDIQATASCVAECDADFDVTATPVTCEGGMLSGGCSGRCEGTCSVEGSASCTGSCSGTCSGSCSAEVQGSCSGNCTGTCEGECSATGADGQCSGTCSGTCYGECDGTVEGSCAGECDGSCSGSCRADLRGTCEGSCTGTCSVEFTEPRCEGGEVSVTADADCSASCEAEASAEATCTEPEVIITFVGDVTGGELAALAATLRTNLPTLLAALEKGTILARASVDLGGRIEGAVGAIGDASLEAIDCTRRAVTVYAEAAASVSVSVEASASVSATATGGAG